MSSTQKQNMLSPNESEDYQARINEIKDTVSIEDSRENSEFNSEISNKEIKKGKFETYLNIHDPSQVSFEGSLDEAESEEFSREITNMEGEFHNKIHCLKNLMKYFS